MGEPTDSVKTMIQKLFSEASKTKKSRFFDDDFEEGCHPDSQRKSQKLDDHFIKDWVAAPLNYAISLGRSYEWSFAAIAQLVDNAQDAQATRLEISIDTNYSGGVGKNIPIMSIVDNGHGMSHEDIKQMLRIGCRSCRADDRDHIGIFGIGFQSGTMNLGRDVIVLTQTSHSRSIVFLLQCLNKGSNLHHTNVPIITYHRQDSFLGMDRSIQSEALADRRLKAIKEFLPINEDFIGEKFGLFGENGTGTQIYIWNLERSGNDYILDWQSRKESDDLTEDEDINSFEIYKITSRPFCTSFCKGRLRCSGMFTDVPLDYSLRSFLEVIYLNPRMKIYVQGSLVNCRPLAKSLHNTKIVNTRIKEKQVQLTLGLCGRDCIYWNCGIFLYWRGRLIEAYKRVGSMVHSAEPGLVGVIDVTDIMNDGDDAVFLESTKEAFRFCKAYKELEEWLGHKTNEYIDEHYIETLHAEWCNNFKSDHELAQCDKCRKWRILNSHFDIKTLPEEWYCCMPPYNGICETPEEVVDHGISSVGGKRPRFYGPWDRNLPS
ncbi:hypothetical protein MKW92_024873 [Papaver armeniacum]|nr:hypothetical protein MKW92_024873 [Papaver armeniacum]